MSEDDLKAVKFEREQLRDLCAKLQTERDRLSNLLEMANLTIKKDAQEISRLKAEVESLTVARRTESEGYNEKFDHCFKNHIAQIVNLEAKADKMAGALRLAFSDLEEHAIEGYPDTTKTVVRAALEEDKE